MSYSRWRSVALAIAALIGLMDATAAAQEKVRLRLNMPPGSAWSFTQNEEMVLDTTVKAGGQQQSLQQKIARKISGSAEVLESDASGKPTAIKFVFDADCGGQMTQMGQQIPVPFA